MQDALSNCGDIYLSATAGHRQSYMDVMVKITALKPVIEPPGISVFFKLVKSDRVLFATMEDTGAFFYLVAMFRSILRKPTVAIVMNPGRALVGRRWYHRLHGFLLRLYRSLPGVTLLSILPFYLDQQLHNLTNNWFYDPQFWDLFYSPKNEASVFVDEISKVAQGRFVLLFLGAANSSKAFDQLVLAMEGSASLRSDMLVIAAGRISEYGGEYTARFSAAGGHLIDRYLSDSDVQDLEELADGHWAFYHPDYNSSSGRFGRAMQLQKQAIVRTHSYLDRIAEKVNYPVIRCEYGDVNRLISGLESMIRTRPTFSAPLLAADFRNTAVMQICNGLNLQRV